MPENRGKNSKTGTDGLWARTTACNIYFWVLGPRNAGARHETQAWIRETLLMSLMASDADDVNICAAALPCLCLCVCLNNEAKWNENKSEHSSTVF